MALVAVKKFHLGLHGEAASITDALIPTAEISQSKVVNLTTDLAARAVKAANETITGNWTYTGTVDLSNTVTLTSGFSQTGANTFSTGTGAVSLNGNTTIGTGRTLTLDSDPTLALHAATKQYVDSVASGLDVKGSVRVATTAALPAYTRTANVITADANGALPAIDGVTLVNTNRLLLKDGAAGADNGIYVVTDVGSAGTPFILTRATDADVSAEVTDGMFTFVEAGTTYSDTGWVLTTNNPITLNTNALTFSQFSGAGSIVAGAGLTKTGNTIDVVAADGTITVNADSIQVATGGITNTQINASAAIAYSKLNLAGSIVDADINASAAIAWTKISKTGSSIADLTTRNAEDVVVTPSGNLAATDVEAALYELQGDINTINGKTWHVAYIWGATGGETTLAKPGSVDIPDNDTHTEVYIDGRKVRRGDGFQYTVDAGGDGITFAALIANQTVELRFYA